MILRAWGGVALGAAVAAPIAVVLHEAAHIAVLEAVGISAHLAALGMGVPVGFEWTFAGLEKAQAHYGTTGGAVAFAAGMGPLLTLSLSFGGLVAYQRWRSPALWAAAVAPVALRLVGLATLLPRYAAGTIDTSDEAIAAHFIGLPPIAIYAVSIAAGGAVLALLVRSLAPGRRLPLAAAATLFAVAGYLAVETAVNRLILGLETWTR